MMKRLFSFILALLMVFVVSSSVCAKTVILDGDWVLEAHGGALEIDSYVGTDADVTLINSFGGVSVIAVGENAFLNNAYVEIVRTDDTFTTIDDYGFDGCYKLQEVVLTASLAQLGVGAFANTSALQFINLEDTSVDGIPAYCFAGSGLSTVALPNTCTSIFGYAFQNCESLASVTIPSSVTEIADNAFSGCEKVVICAPYGSYAVEYAIAHDYDYAYSGMQKYTFYRGDADGDGDITIMDATRVQRVLAHFDDDVDGTIAIRAAMDEDRVLGIMDATRIQRQLAQFDDPYGIGKEVTVYLLPDGSIFDPDKINV